MFAIMFRIQGLFIGLALALITMNLILDDEAQAIQTTTNGWNTIRQCNLSGNGILLRAACAKVLPAANVLQEAAYWTTTVNSTGRALSGQHHYVRHFTAGQPPPNDVALVIERVLVESDNDVSTAYGPAKQIQLMPLNIGANIII